MLVWPMSLVGQDGDVWAGTSGLSLLSSGLGGRLEKVPSVQSLGWNQTQVPHLRWQVILQWWPLPGPYQEKKKASLLLNFITACRRLGKSAVHM